jgi:hypothetical protein
MRSRKAERIVRKIDGRFSARWLADTARIHGTGRLLRN